MIINLSMVGRVLWLTVLLILERRAISRRVRMSCCRRHRLLGPSGAGITTVGGRLTKPVMIRDPTMQRAHHSRIFGHLTAMCNRYYDYFKLRTNGIIRKTRSHVHDRRSLTNIPAAPSPLPTHILVHNSSPLRLRNSSRPVTTWRTPALK